MYNRWPLSLHFSLARNVESLQTGRGCLLQEPPAWTTNVMEVRKRLGHLDPCPLEATAEKELGSLLCQLLINHPDNTSIRGKELDNSSGLKPVDHVLSLHLKGALLVGLADFTASNANVIGDLFWREHPACKSAVRAFTPHAQGSAMQQTREGMLGHVASASFPKVLQLIA